MDLFFLRHARACDRSPKFRPDSTRPLTAEGEEEIRKVARGIKRLDIDIDLILTSPYVRAARTAEIFHDIIKRGKLRTTDALASTAELAAVIHELEARYAKAESIVLVGHEPHMSSLMSLLLSGRSDISIDFKKAGFAKFSIDELKAGKCACLKWLMTPKQLARLGKAG
jgi:phosphohistidine phosphatase